MVETQIPPLLGKFWYKNLQNQNLCTTLVQAFLVFSTALFWPQKLGWSTLPNYYKWLDVLGETNNLKSTLINNLTLESFVTAFLFFYLPKINQISLPNLVQFFSFHECLEETWLERKNIYTSASKPIWDRSQIKLASGECITGNVGQNWPKNVRMSKAEKEKPDD